MNIIANHKASKFIIYTDSKSVLLVLQNKDTSSPLITKLLNKLNTLSKNNNIIFTWIPSHIGIQENEKADKAAKKSSSNWYVQIKNPKYRSKTNHKEIHIRQMAEIMGQSYPKQTPWNTRSYRRVANRLQKYQKRRSNTCQIAYWAHPHYSFTPVKRGGCPSVPIMQSTTHNQTYPSKL